MKTKKRTIPECLRERAVLSGEDIAYIFDDVSYTWKECMEITDRLAQRLYEKGVRKGTHVGLWGVNTIEWVFHYYAVLKLGAVGVLLNYSYKEMEMEKVLNRTEVEYLAVGEPKGDLDYEKILLLLKDRLPAMREWFSMKETIDSCRDAAGEDSYLWKEDGPGEEDTAVIIFTSGTTCEPKGVMLGHGQITEAMDCVARGMRWSRNDRLLMPLPLFHGSGANCGLLVSLLSGMTIVLMRYYRSVEAMALMEKYRCTVFNAVPSMLLSMMKNPHFSEYDLSSYQSGTISGSVISEENYRKICEAFHADKLLTAYGMTETSTLNTLVDYEAPFEERIGHVGKPFPGMELRIWRCGEEKEARPGEVGEIQLRGKCIMQGYYHMEEKTKEQTLPGGWFRTGDAGYVDEEGRLYFKNRLGDMIVRGGENISPSEIECCIEQYDEALEAVKVVGVKAPVIQEEVTAFIKTKREEISERKVQDFVRQRLADFKVPKYVFKIDEFPMTGSGKIDTKKLRVFAEKLVEKRKKEEEKL